MEQERIDKALAYFEELKKSRNLSQEAAAKLVGTTGSAISQIKSGKYGAQVDNIICKIEKYAALDEDHSNTYREVEYAETYISTKVYDTIRLCHVKGGLAIFSGAAGIGKTKAAQKYASDNPTNSIYIAINPCLTSMKSILKILCAKIGARPERQLDDMWMSIREKLSDHTVIIFDEAQHLPYKPIEMLRSLVDSFTDAGQTLGIIFIGNPETIRRLGAKQKAEFAQIANRTKQKLVYGTKQIQRHDIELLFPILQNNGMSAETDFLWGIAQSEQGLRGAVNLFGNAYDNKNYTLEGLVSMAKHMKLDLSGIDISKIKKGAA